MAKPRPSIEDLLGWAAITGRDITGNANNPLEGAPNRTTMPNRGETLDRFTPVSVTGENEAAVDDDNDDDDALMDEVEEAQFVNSQLDPVEEHPSSKDPHRFVFQNRRK